MKKKLIITKTQEEKDAEVKKLITKRTILFLRRIEYGAI